MIEGQSRLSEPLTKLLRKDQVWKWGEEEQGAFDALKYRLMTAPLLRTPSPDREFL